ncbi:MAG: helix-turn-helix domain-containing protein [Paludibacteraceae bacterium]|nr:helix-turn-helix domain-containing protein [Paludibacteraceae bacterium]
METITFEQLPQAVTTLIKKVSKIEELVAEKSTQTEQTERFLTVEEAAKLLNITKQTIYEKVSRGELPYMKRGKRLYFSNIELYEYLKGGRKKTNAEIDAEAETYLKKKKGLNNGK